MEEDVEAPFKAAAAQSRAHENDFHEATDTRWYVRIYPYTRIRLHTRLSRHAANFMTSRSLQRVFSAKDICQWMKGGNVLLRHAGESWWGAAESSYCDFHSLHLFGMVPRLFHASA